MHNAVNFQGQESLASSKHILLSQLQYVCYILFG